MRRFPFVIGATVAGVAAVLSYHTGHTTASPPANGGDNSPQPSATPPKATPPKANKATPPKATPREANKANATKANTKNTTTTTPKSTTTTPKSSTTNAPATTSGPSAATKTATGRSEQYGYGVLATRVTVKGSSIVNVQVVGLQTAESYSQQLANYAIPQLRREVLAAQSSRVSGVTGATYTSQAYLASVQSALDQLHL